MTSEELKREAGIDADTPCRTLRFGSDEQIVERIISLIEAKEKTATFSLPWLHDRGLGETPQVGGYAIVVDASEEPRLLVRTTHVIALTFAEVTSDHTRFDGPQMRDPAAWRALHWDYFNAQLQGFGMAAAEDMPLLVERFEVCKS